MKVLIILLFVPMTMWSQDTFLIVDSQTQEPIPHVNIFSKNAMYGATSDLYGKFEWASRAYDTLIFNAVGYKGSVVPYQKLESIIKMESLIVINENSGIKKPKTEKRKVIGNNELKNYNDTRSCSGVPWMIGCRIPYQTIYQQTPFLGTLIVPTESKVKKSKFAVRLYDGADTLFLKPLHEKPIYGIAGKGKRNTQIKLHDQMIKFPENGLIIMLEFLVISQNESQTIVRPNGLRKRKARSYEPFFLFKKKKEISDNSIIYYKGKWTVEESIIPDFPEEELALQLTLSD